MRNRIHMNNAYDDLLEFLADDEPVVGIVFGDWCDEFSSPPDPAIPKEIHGKLLSFTAARPYLAADWSFRARKSSADTYAAYIWTDRRVIWVVEYDGATWLDSALRDPRDCRPATAGRS